MRGPCGGVFRVAGPSMGLGKWERKFPSNNSWNNDGILLEQCLEGAGVFPKQCVEGFG